MTPEEWQRIRPILESAIELDPARRPGFLDGVCSDTSLRNEIESLIASHELADNILNPDVGPNLDVLEEYKFTLPSGKRIGVYEIVSEIAHGGMGAVYRAIRADGQYKQEVALKIVRADVGAELAAARFRNERQILASLNHSNIAKVLDGGTTADGLPYFVMELIDGLAITDYCDHHKLTIDARLILFRTVCSAVHYAHQHLVIHRDIKPTNILVTSDGIPKLLDFGIAKILDPGRPATSATMTSAGAWLMTPEYASPEQLLRQTITTASDVYSLGLVLYELLAGHRAYHFSNHMPHEIARTILEIEPERPSSAIRRNEAVGEGRTTEVDITAALVSSLRSDSLEKLHRRLSGDLDDIVLKAVHKESNERYTSVDQFSEDIRRHMGNLPIVARRSTLGYRSRKYMRRHKFGVVAASLILLSLLAGIVLTLREARIARTNQHRAERRFNDVRRLANSLIFDVHDSIKDLPGSTSARKIIIDDALQYLNNLAQESGNDLALERELATAYERVGLVQGHYLETSLGDTQGSLDSYMKALHIREQVRTKSSDWDDQLALAQIHRLVAHQEWAVSNRHGARQHIDLALAISEALNINRPNNLKILRELALEYADSGRIGSAGQPGDAARLQDAEAFRRAVAADEALLRVIPDDFEVQYRYAVDLSHLGDVVGATNRDSALPFYKKELEIQQNLHRRSPDTVLYARGVARALGEIATVYHGERDFKRALEYDLRDLAIYQQLIRIDPKNNLLQRGLAIEYGNVATRLSETGNTALSLTYMHKSLEIMRPIVASSPQNTDQRLTLAQIYVASGSNLMRGHQPRAALDELREACKIGESVYEMDRSEAGACRVAACARKMGQAAALAGNARLASEYFHQALAVVEPLLPSPTPDPSALYVAADSYSGLGDLEVEKAHSDGQSVDDQRAHWIEARLWYGKSLEAWHRIEHPSFEDPDGMEAGDPVQVAEKLQRCKAALSSSN